MKYGCHNRAAYKTSTPVQNGWWMDGVTRYPKMEAQPFRMAAECQYTHTDLGKADTRCDGCKWRASP